MNFELLFEKIEESKGEYIDFLKNVCEIESPTDYKKGVDEVGNFFAEKAKEKGFKVEIFPQEIAGNVVVITMNADVSERPFCLSAHLDTVHKVGAFGNPAVTFEGDKMIGPGICDDKGGAVCGFWAMDALNKMGYNKRPVVLILQSDEETSSKESNKATVKYICERAKDAVGFVNLEPCCSGNGLTLQRKGISKIKFTVYGIDEHASRCVYGANAIAEAAYKIIELEKYKDVDYITMSCDVISAGKSINIVPGKCEFYVDARFVNNEAYQEIQNICKSVADTVYVKGTSCVVEEISNRPAMSLSKVNTDFYEEINIALKKAGLEKVEIDKSIKGGSDAAYITEKGIPVVDSLGIVGNGAHKTSEYILLSKITLSPKRLAAIVANF